MTCYRQRARNFEYSYMISLLVLLLLTTSSPEQFQKKKTKEIKQNTHIIIIIPSQALSGLDGERKKESRRYRLHTLNFRYIRLGANLFKKWEW